MLSLTDILSVPSNVEAMEPSAQGPRTENVKPIREIDHYKYRLACVLRPSRILGLGVRAGQAAKAFLRACPRAHYVGLDQQDYASGSVVLSLDTIRDILWGRFPDAWIELYPWDSSDEGIAKRLAAHFPSGFDLVHVDSDQSEQRCLRDLRFADDLVRTGGHILIEHYDTIAAVRKAANVFQEQRRYEVLYLPSPRGQLLLCKPKIPLARHACCPDRQT